MAPKRSATADRCCKPVMAMIHALGKVAGPCIVVTGPDGFVNIHRLMHG